MGELNIEGCQRLCEAVLARAGMDYRAWYKILLADPGNKAAMREAAELERFFHSNTFKLFSMGGLNPETTIRDLRRLAEMDFRYPLNPPSHTKKPSESGDEKEKKGKNEMSIVNKPAVQCDVCGAVQFAEWGGQNLGWLLPSGWRNSPYNENFCACAKHRELTALWDRNTQDEPKRGWRS